MYTKHYRLVLFSKKKVNLFTKLNFSPDPLLNSLFCMSMCFIVFPLFFFFLKMAFSSSEIRQWFIESGRQAVSTVIERAGKVQYCYFCVIVPINNGLT